MSSSVQRTLGPLEVTGGDARRSPVVTDCDREANWLGLVTRAMGRCGLSHKAMAIEMDVDRGLLSAQLLGAPNKHLSFRRMHTLSREFWRELVILIIDFYQLEIGVSEQDRRDLAYGREMREAHERRFAR